MDKRIVILLIILAALFVGKKEFAGVQTFDSLGQCLDAEQEGNCIPVDARIAACSGIREGGWALDEMGHAQQVDSERWVCYYRTSGPLLPEGEKRWIA